MSTNPEAYGPISPSTRYRHWTHADLIVNYLVQIGVDYVFGVPGGAIEPFYDALARQSRLNAAETATGPSHKALSRKTRRKSSGLKLIVSRHEAGAAYMADGYARETGKLGVCCATTGPGTTNLITGVASAYADRTPMLVITAQTALPSFGNQGLQESSADAIDTVGMLEHCTRYNSLVSHPDQLERKLHTALVCAYQKPRGPVHLSIPIDIQRFPVESGSAPFDVATLFRQPEVMDTRSFDTLCEKLIDARKVVLFLGSGCREAVDPIIQFAELIGASIVSTPSGKSWVNAYHPLYRGVFGFAGHASARNALLDDEVDLVLAVGTSLDEISTSGWDQGALLNEKLIHVDATMENFVYSPMAQLHTFGHLPTIFSELIQIITSHQQREQKVFDLGRYHRAPKEALNVVSQGEAANNNITFGTPRNVSLEDAGKCLSSETPIKPQRVMCELMKRFPRNTRFLSDAGNSWAWTTHYLHLRSSGNYRVGMGFGAMAWAIGAAVGTALSSRGAAVVCITGDGSFLMSSQELTVAVQQQLPIIYVVLNDQALGMVKHGQRLGGGEPIGFELPPVDFAGVARAMGARAHTIRKPQEFAELDIKAMCNAKKPTLLDVYIDPEEVPPMKARMKVLGSSKFEGD